MPQPEAYLGYADKLFDEKGKLTNDGTRNFPQDFMPPALPRDVEFGTGFSTPETDVQKGT